MREYEVGRSKIRAKVQVSGVYGINITAGSQGRIRSLKEENAKAQNNLAENLSHPLSIHLAFTPPDGEPSGYTYKAR